jgi:hypothetical protein
MSIPKKKKKSYTSVCSLHHISSLVLNKHFSGAEGRWLLRLLNTHSTLGRRLRETVRTDRHTCCCYFCLAIPKGIWHCICHTPKKKIHFYKYKTNPLLYRGRVSSDTCTMFYLLEVRHYGDYRNSLACLTRSACDPTSQYE